MAYLIGTDEAGYGPNLGPLIVSASLWEIPDELLGHDLYPHLDDVICNRAETPSTTDRVVIADSKLVYRPGGGLQGLERGVLSLLCCTGSQPRTWRDLWQSLAGDCLAQLDGAPWYAEYESQIPGEAALDEIETLTACLSGHCESTRIHCRRLQSAAVFPAQLNDGIDQQGNKATVLSLTTLSLVAELMDGLPPAKVFINCDKHGGRNRYVPVLQQIFPEFLIEVRRESRAESIYRWGPRDRRVEIQFVAKGESCIASALASMTAKYLRELAMQAFNQFWTRHISGLRPTAGYPTDAKRFRQEIAPVQRQLGVSDRILWRNR